MSECCILPAAISFVGTAKPRLAAVTFAGHRTQLLLSIATTTYYLCCCNQHALAYSAALSFSGAVNLPSLPGTMNIFNIGIAALLNVCFFCLQ